MEANPGEASSPTATAPAAAPVAAAAVAVVPEATVSFQSPASAPPPIASHAPAPSPVEMVSSSGLFVPPGMMTAMVAAAGRGALSAGPLVKVGKKRGRPRKYGPDGSLIQPLNATPISASAPMSAAPYHHQLHQPPQQQQFGFHFSSIGDMVACSAGGNFTPHIITVAPGEDVTMKVISFSQQGPRAICILSANGVISNVTLRQPDSSGGTLTYEGRFELLSLSGSFMPTENSGARSRSGGMSVSLASPDGRVVGGGVAGLLVAASPVQIVVGSFLPSYPMEPKQKKARVVAAPILSQAPPAVQLSSADTHSSEQGQHSSASPRMNVVTSSAYSADQNWASTVVQSAPAEASRSASSGDLNLTASGS
ncbi:unnamed protein product [Triticum turgidum subsp. durum]|uniref:AT-hook motif nuclear-localized protein n=1 Tax=Triticum turgidum subsp. durum TaxID=4567 RepID=A0A9R1BPH6_TRITD|nr:unnamed protein product [Triticum turgidum subsp. durum]